MSQWLPLNIETNKPHDYPAHKSAQQEQGQQCSHNNSKGDIIHVTKAAAKRSTLMPITRVKAANLFH
jgi:hypothetical protein